jgi:hypothetical protein
MPRALRPGLFENLYAHVQHAKKITAATIVSNDFEAASFSFDHFFIQIRRMIRLQHVVLKNVSGRIWWILNSVCQGHVARQVVCARIMAPGAFSIALALNFSRAHA